MRLGFIFLVACGCAATARQKTPFAGPDACADAPLLSRDQLLRGAHADAMVAVDGVPHAVLTCTLMGCVGENQCCNRCGGDYVLLDTPEHVVALAGLEGCHGNQCDVTCHPFSRTETRPFRFVGLHRHQPAGETSTFARSTIEVKRICLRPSPP